MLNNCQTLDESAPGPTLEDIEHIGGEELEHFLMLNRVIAEFGGRSLGIMQVLTDPRSSLPQCLQAMLTAKLTDNDGRQLLIKLGAQL